METRNRTKGLIESKNADHNKSAPVHTKNVIYSLLSYEQGIKRRVDEAEKRRKAKEDEEKKRKRLESEKEPQPSSKSQTSTQN